MSHYVQSYHDSNANPNTNPKNKCDCCEMSVNEQDDHNMSHETYFHACQPNCQWDLHATQYFVKWTQFNPMKHFCKEQPNENSFIVENKFNPIHGRPCVHFGTKLKVLIVFLIENKQQSHSVHLLTIIKRNKL